MKARLVPITGARLCIVCGQGSLAAERARSSPAECAPVLWRGKMELFF
jgi:hypothetical protein